VVADGAADIAATYTLFCRRLSEEGLIPDPPIPSHLEFLMDRHGYLRARWVPADGQGWADSKQLIIGIEQLNQAPSGAPAPDAHVR
jgi:copper resistance protein D